MTAVHGLLVWVFTLWLCCLGLTELGKQLLEDIQWATASPNHDFKVKAMSELSAVRTWWWNSSIVTGIFSGAVPPLGMRLQATRKAYLFSWELVFCFLCEVQACRWCSSVKTTGHTVPWCEAVINLWCSTVRSSYGNLRCFPDGLRARTAFLWKPECKLVSFWYAVWVWVGFPLRLMVKMWHLFTLRQMSRRNSC